VQQFRQPSKSVVIRSGVDLDLFKPMREQRMKTRAALGVDDATPLIGLFGDFIPLKRQDVFLKAAQRVRQQCPDARFLLVGNERANPESHAYRRALDPLIEQVKAVVLPWPNDLAAFLNGLDITVVASTTETGPLILFQSMACGVPAVSTPVGHAPDLLVSDETGELFAIDDDRALSQTLLKLIQNPNAHTTLRQNILQGARQLLDVRHTRERVVEVLKEQLRTA
jgi:glycosyltransferase involved in cell wall biosynthesis